MNVKLTLSFDEEVIARAKKFAEENGISLSKLTEYFLIQATKKKYSSIHEFPVAEWLQDFMNKEQVGCSNKPPNNKAIRDSYYAGRNAKHKSAR